MWQAWLNLAAGLWLILCGLVPSLQTPGAMIVPGIVVFILGFWTTARVKSWEGTINGIAGIWLFLSGVWFELWVPWNFLILGALITVLSIVNLIEHPSPATQTPHTAK